MQDTPVPNKHKVTGVWHPIKNYQACKQQEDKIHSMKKKKQKNKKNQSTKNPKPLQTIFICSHSEEFPFGLRLWTVKMQMPYRRNGILKLLSIIYTLVFMKVLSPCQIAGFDVIGGGGREIR